VGRVRANIERHDRVCFEASEAGRFLPSNVALEFSVQYASVVAFGTARIIKDSEEKRRALYSLKWLSRSNQGTFARSTPSIKQNNPSRKKRKRGE
jgi:nitroimidazol reductase NimA-like FMN-containing flavoprotein (pyridoxamine 5'-phosphate oxidase superfamily)